MGRKNGFVTPSIISVVVYTGQKANRARQRKNEIGVNALKGGRKVRREEGAH